MHTVVVGNKTLSLPSLVPSISSFETQLDPLSALSLQNSLREPVSLVSAYDVERLGKEFVDLCGEYKKSAVLLLDSGGYEHSHVQRYAGKKAPSWTFEDYKTVCGYKIHDFAFSYDYFWCDEGSEQETAEDFELRILGEFFHGHDFLVPEQLIPVLHFQTRSNDKCLSEEQALNLVARIATECKSPFIAIPERELGDGLIERFNLAKKICVRIAASNPNVSLHVLGCGNPLSFSFMCVAGARMADGLEWYRTYAADNFHLHHFHQEPLFDSGSQHAPYNPNANWILSLDVPYRVKVATLNLMTLQSFTNGLAPRLDAGTVNEFIAKSYGKKAAAIMQAFEA